MLAEWMLDPAVVHLNHGSYGGCPRAVFDAATAIRARLEASPMRFFVRDWQGELDRARAVAAAFVGADPSRFAFVSSATSGVAIALASAELATGDDIVTTSHAYRACKNQLDRLAAASGARVGVVPIALPLDADAFVDSVFAAITPRTRLAVLDHVTSPTALRLPIERLVAPLIARGVQVIVDGAHVPGQIAVDVEALGASWYAGNFHKWTCAPKSTGFIAASAAVAARTRPVVTSHGASAEYGPANRFHAELDWAGTYDPSAHLVVPVALDEVARLGGGWDATRARNHALAIEMRGRLIDALGSRAICADDALGTMAAVPITLPMDLAPLALQRALLDDGWEVPIVDTRAGRFVRVSAHLYNDAAQVDALARVLCARGVTG